MKATFLPCTFLTLNGARIGLRVFSNFTFAARYLKSAPSNGLAASGQEFWLLAPAPSLRHLPFCRRLSSR